MRLLHFLLYRLGTSCLLACEFLLRIAISAPVILLYKFQNYLAEGCKKGTRENRLTAILPSSRSSRNIRVALPLIFAPYHRLLQEVVIQTQISLNTIATVYKLTIFHNRILCLTASSQKVGGEYGMWEKRLFGKPRISDGNIQALIHHTDNANTLW